MNCDCVKRRYFRVSRVAHNITTRRCFYSGCDWTTGSSFHMHQVWPLVQKKKYIYIYIYIFFFSATEQFLTYLLAKPVSQIIYRSDIPWFSVAKIRETCTYIHHRREVGQYFTCMFFVFLQRVCKSWDKTEYAFMFQVIIYFLLIFSRKSLGFLKCHLKRKKKKSKCWFVQGPLWNPALNCYSGNENESNKVNPSHSWGQEIQKFSIQ